MARTSSQLLVVILGLVCWNSAQRAFTGLGSRQAVPRGIALNAEAATFGECKGRCRGDGSWTSVESIEVATEADAKAATDAWELFKAQFPKAVENKVFMDTPVEEDDVKYRWHRLMKTLKIDGSSLNAIMKEEALPLVVDSNHVENTFEAMVRGSDYDTALTVVKKNPGIVTAGDGIEENMGMAQVAADFQQVTRPLNRFLQGVLR
mmetsp:Transcript_56496/g.132513  ORF Transcript_56496/g.132513 Transcript_56496/m.132513 type:complete len:206 (+) Transcript_56496:70-687(+)